MQVGWGTFDVPPGGGEQSWEWRPAISGRILALGGHLHEHGSSLRLEDVATGELLWVGEADTSDPAYVADLYGKLNDTGDRRAHAGH